MSGLQGAETAIMSELQAYTDTNQTTGEPREESHRVVEVKGGTTL